MAELPSAIGRYEVISRLGQGGMGSLFLAKDPKIGRLVAIKLVRQEFDSPDARQRFAREAQSAGTLRHPNIVTIFDVDEHEGLPFIAMEYVDGETLSEMVRRKAPLAIAKRLKWIEELCSGLAYAHRQGVVHRDIKPANLMLDNEGTLKILDFGLARKEASKFTQSHTIIGTPNYMSPEQIRAGEVGPRSDIFAVGAVLYEVLAYTEAFPGTVHQAMHKILYESPKPLEDFVAGIDRSLVNIVARSLEKDADRRYQDLAVMRGDLASVRQRLENQVEDSAQTIMLGGSTERATGPTPMPTSAPSSGGSRKLGTHRVSLQKRRAAQIETLLSDARTHFESGDVEKAKELCEQALMFDTDLPDGLQLMDEIAAEEERRQIAALLEAARTELQKGQLEAADKIVQQAIAISPQSPEVLQLREAVETTKRELERARQVQDILRRARQRFTERSFEGALRAIGEVLALDPGNTAARDLQTRAQEAIESRDKRAERDAAAQSAVTEARALFEKGDKESAIKRLESFQGSHDLVTAFLASLRGEQVAEEVPPMPEEQPAAAPATGPSTVAFMPGRSDTGAGVRVGTGTRRPVYLGVAVGLVILIAAGTYFWTRPREAEPPPPGPAASAPAATPAPAPAPAVPPPVVVAPPAALTETPQQSQSMKEVLEAYRILGQVDRPAADRIAQAQKIVAQIRKQDPGNAQLKDLTTAIQTVRDDEKRRADAAAAALAAAKTPANAPPNASPNANTGSGGGTPNAGGGATAPANPPSRAPEGTYFPPERSEAAPTPAPPAPPPKPVTPDFTVLPGGGYAAPSAPPSPALLAEAERPGIEAAIFAYAKALSAKDLKAVSQVRTYTANEAKNWEKAFRDFKDYQLAVKILSAPVVEPAGDKATIKVEERILQTQKNGMQLTLSPNTKDYKLEKIGGRWRILPPSS